MPAAASRRRRLLGVGAIVAAAVLVYGAVVALYAVDQRARIGAACEPTAGEPVVTVSAESVDALHDRMGITIDVTEEGPLATTDLGLYAGPVTVVVDGAAGDRAFVTAADSVAGRSAVSLISDGEIEVWPFDTHVATARIAILQTVDGQLRGYVPQVCVEGQVSGWSLSATAASGSDDIVIGDDPVPAVVITATRSPATVAFGLVILLLLVALPVLGLTVSISAYRGRRKTEATLMSWMAAMLFATIPLRGFLPGSPPVGSWVDYLVVLWVVGGLVASLVVYVLAWLRWTPNAGERPAR